MFNGESLKSKLLMVFLMYTLKRFTRQVTPTCLPSFLITKTINHFKTGFKPEKNLFLLIICQYNKIKTWRVNEIFIKALKYDVLIFTVSKLG